MGWMVLKEPTLITANYGVNSSSSTWNVERGGGELCVNILPRRYYRDMRPVAQYGVVMTRMKSTVHIGTPRGTCAVFQRHHWKTPV
jgi:flavin reductase (DIM6/NTAB) family NADH-FMN oxidoreductase RutF